MMRNRQGRLSRRGNSLLEFALVSIFLVPLFLGTVNVGLNLGRSVQVSQVARDAGHMYARQIDFSLTENKELIVRLAAGLNMTVDDGDGVVILSKMMKIGDAECALGGFPPGTCANTGKAVVIERVYIGHEGLRSSSFGTPANSLIDSQGKISPVQYTNNPALVATGFDALMGTMIDGEVSYVAEAYFSAPDWYLNQSYTSDGAYARSIY